MLFRHVTKMVKNVMLDLPNVDDVSNAGVFVAEASVSAPEDVCYRFKRNLRITQNTLFALKNENKHSISGRGARAWNRTMIPETSAW